MPVRLRWLWMCALASLCACAVSPEGGPTATPTATFAAYARPTQAAPPTAVTPASPPTATPAPTATPFTHIVREGDTMLGIAFLYGVPLEELLAANPDANPRLLSIGQALVVPLPGTDLIASGLPTPTPIPFQLSPVYCYPAASAGTWCLTMATNSGTGAIEGISATISLLDKEGTTVASSAADSPLSLVPADASTLLAAHFEPGTAPFVGAFAVPLAAVEAAAVEERYLEVGVQAEESSPGPERLTWKVSGQVSMAIAPPEGSAASLAVVCVGFGETGEPVGYVKWEAQALEEGSKGFDLTLFSLGPPIVEVQIWAEGLLVPLEIPTPSP